MVREHDFGRSIAIGDQRCAVKRRAAAKKNRAFPMDYYESIVVNYFGSIVRYL